METTTMRNRTADKPAPPAAPSIAWADDESRQTVIQVNSRHYADHAGAAHQYGVAAKRLAGEAEAISREVQAAQKRLDDKLHEQRAADNDAQMHQRAAQAFAATITTLGGQVPAVPADGVLVHPPERQVPAREHAAQYGGPLLPPRQEAALASFEAAHDALAAGETGEPLGLRAAALQQHPYADPHPTGTHPLAARPEERPQ